VNAYPKKTMIESAAAILQCNEVAVTVFAVKDEKGLNSSNNADVFALISAFRNNQPSRPSVRLKIGKFEYRRYEKNMGDLKMAEKGASELLYGLCCFLVASGVEVHVTKRNAEGGFDMQVLPKNCEAVLPVFDIEEAFYKMTDCCLVGED